MSVNTTTNYISQINQSYPIAGQDNNSQGFRDNFKNISAALTSVNAEVGALNLNSVKLAETNDFGTNIIKRASFQNCSTVIYDTTIAIQSGNIQVDYTNGSYQKFKIDAGQNYFTVAGWPTNAQSGSIVIAISSDTIAGAYVTFQGTGLINLGPDSFPVELANDVNQLFQLWNDGTTVYVKSLGGTATLSVEEIISRSKTDLPALTSLTLGGTNTYTTSTNTNSLFATVVEAASKLGNIALLPNIITAITTTAPVLDNPGDTVATKFPVISVTDIKLGATVQFPNAGGVYTITSFTDNVIAVTPAFSVGAFIPGDAVTIKNPEFTYQPRLATMKSIPAVSTTSTLGDLRGELYTDGTTLYVTHSDYTYNTPNKIKISGDAVTMVTQPVAANSTALATTEFVHNIMPYGAIIMWYGLVSAVPSGWALCNGSNSTPDLRGKFIIGASVDVSNVGGVFNAATEITGSATQTGGSKDAVVVTHSHTAAATIESDGVHNHNYYAGDGLGLPGYPTVELDGNNNISRTIPTSDAGAHTHAVNVTIASAGESADNKNLPPYYALCYIMKVTGA